MFALKIIRVKNFRVIKFSRFRLIRKIFFNGRQLQYGERGICSGRSDIYLGECGLARTGLFTDHRRVILFFAC